MYGSNDPTVLFETEIRNMDPAELGRLLKEYVAESNHNGWDGWTSRDITGIRRLFEDMLRYYNGVVETDPDNFKKLSSVNPV